MALRRALPADVEGMVRLHAAAFPEQGTTALGPGWLRRMYRVHLEDDKGVAVVAVDSDGQVVGLAAGGRRGLSRDYFRKHRIRHLPLYGWKLLTRSALRRAVGRKLVNAWKKRRSPRQEAKGVSLPEPTGGLLSICMHPDRRGGGVAGRLMKAFEDACYEAGFRSITLYVRRENARAIAFYRKCGWRAVDEGGPSILFAVSPRPISGREKDTCG